MESVSTGTTAFHFKPSSVCKKFNQVTAYISASSCNKQSLPEISEYHAKSVPMSERPPLPSCPCKRAKVSSLSKTLNATLTSL